jgi:hypothetical protein
VVFHTNIGERRIMSMARKKKMKTIMDIKMSINTNININTITKGAKSLYRMMGKTIRLNKVLRKESKI